MQFQTSNNDRQGAFEDSEFAYGTTLFQELQASLGPEKVEVRNEQ